MTLEEALALVDEMKPNQVDRAWKVQWLDELDRRVFQEVFARHEPDESTPAAFTGYTDSTDGSTELLIPEPYSPVYRWFLEMQIDLANMELGKYNNSLLLFESAWKRFAGAWHRAHLPITTAQYQY